MPSKYRKGGRSPGELLPLYRNKVLLNDKDKPLGLIMKGQQIGSLMFKPPKVMTIKNYVNEKKRLAYKPSSPPQKPNKYNKLRKIKSDLLCQPQDFLYREFKIANGSKKSFFNFVKSHNTTGFSNILKMPANVSRGLLPVGKGEQGVVLVGCIDDTCKTKVAIKIPSKGSEKDAIREFKNNKMIYDGCSQYSPHIVQPILQQRCGSSSVTYYEFFNGGSLDSWIPRHSKSLTLNNYKTILFQVLYTLQMIYATYPKFRHHDLHSGNIMVRTDGIPSSGYTRYGTQYIRNDGIFTAIGDFGFANSSTHPNPGVIAGNYAGYGVNKNSTVGQDVFTLLANMTKQANRGGVKSVGKFFESVTGVKMASHFKGSAFNIRLIKNLGKVDSIKEMLNNPFFDSIKKGVAAPRPAPKPVAAPAKPPTPKPLATNSRCGARAVKGKPGVLGMSTADMRKVIKAHTDIKIPVGASRGALCKMLSKFPTGQRLMGNNSVVARAVAPKRAAPPAYRAVVSKAPSPMKFTKRAGNNATKRVRGMQKVRIAPRNPAKAPTPKPVKAPTPKAVRAPTPQNNRTKNPTLNVTRNNSGRVRIQRKVCDSQSRKAIDEILVGFGMDPKSYKSKKIACDAIADASQKIGKLGRFVTKAQEAKEKKQFLKNLKAQKF